MIKEQENHLLLRRFLLVIACNGLMVFGLANVIAATQPDSTAFSVQKRNQVMDKTADTNLAKGYKNSFFVVSMRD